VIRLTRQDVLAHQHAVPWPELYQIEQDLLLSLAMRAIFSDPSVLSVDTMIASLQHYMRAEKTHVPRSEFIEHIRGCLSDRTGFCSDLKGLLRQGEEWDAQAAGAFIEQQVLTRLPD
jgi:hypothetical protein